MHVRTEHDHQLVPFSSQLKWTPGGHGLLGALPRSYQVTPDIPDRRRATQQKEVRPDRADSLKESQLAAGRDLLLRRRTSPTTANHNSKPRSDRPRDHHPGRSPLPLAKTYNGNLADQGYPTPTSFIWDPWSDPRIVPCCYVVRIDITDRALSSNVWAGGHANAGWEAIEIGF